MSDVHSTLNKAVHGHEKAKRQLNESLVSG